MISFGQLKNNLEIIKKYLTKMQFFTLPGQKISAKDLQETNFRRANNQLFLPLINFVLVQFSPELFVKILQLAPTIKYMPDRQFIEQVFLIGRKILFMEISLTVDQFLSNKYFQRKVQFISLLAQKVFEWQQVNKKANNRILSITEQYPVQQRQQLQTYSHNFNDSGSQDSDEAPRAISTKPISLQTKKKEVDMQQTAPIHKNTNKLMKHNLQQQQDQFDPDKQYQRILANRKQKQKIKRPIETPLSLIENEQNFANQFISQKIEKEQKKIQQQIDLNKYKISQKLNKIPQTKKYHKPMESQQQQDSQEQYVTKDEFNKMMKFMKDISHTITNMSNKFQTFQQHVNTQIKNINAKMVMLQSNVKMIKDNL